jgi:hypothetical protein
VPGQHAGPAGPSRGPSRELNIGYVKASKEAVAALRQALPDCKVNGP